MENKYKNEIPNIMLDGAHLNFASIPFIVMKWFGKVMPSKRPNFRPDSNNGNASIKSDQVYSHFRHWTTLPLMCGHANITQKITTYILREQKYLCNTMRKKAKIKGDKKY